MTRIDKKIIMIAVFIFTCSASIVLALDSAIMDVPFEYNVLPTIKSGEIIDNKNNSTLSFNLFSNNVENIYYNDSPVEIVDGEFSIDVSNLKGENTITFKNDANEVASFKYYFPDDKGKVDGYELVKGKKLNVYVTTIRGIKVIYTDKEKTAIKKLDTYLKPLTDKFLEEVDTIVLNPFATTSKIAATTKGRTITLYKYSKYDAKTQKHIIYHEIAHTWASNLMDEKIIDYSYTKYTEIAKKDKKSVSKYSSKYSSEKGRYSEDFADSVALYLISAKSFSKKYPNRANYIEELFQK